jgi:hypothetical protein
MVGEVVIEPAPTRPQLIGAILDAIVTEKRGQYQNRDDLSIDLKTLPSSFSAFANVDPNELKRVLSNLIDNSAESIRGKGEITVGLSSQNDQVIITVRDTGCGIAPEVLARVGEKGFTHGKCGGHGLGVHHAKSTAKMWGGALTIDSQLGKGTSATLTLPAASAPAWFVHEITLRSPETVVIVDDDPTMHELWKVRFAEVGHGVELRHFTSPDQFVSWVATAEIDRLKTTFLVDYEFRGSKINGIELIESTGIVDASILVTASFDAPAVQEGARRLWVKIIPKLIASNVPIRTADVIPGLVLSEAQVGMKGTG